MPTPLSAWVWVCERTLVSACKHALQAKVPGRLDKLNTIIKIYSDAHVGLTSKWLVHSTDRTHVPIREPEERRYTHKHTHTHRRTIPFSYNLCVSLSFFLRHFCIFAISWTHSLSLTHTLTRTCKHTPLPLGTVPLAFAAWGEKTLKQWKWRKKVRTRQKEQVRKKETGVASQTAQDEPDTASSHKMLQKSAFGWSKLFVSHFHSEPILWFKKWNFTELPKYVAIAMYFFLYSSHCSFPVFQIKATFEFKQTDLLSLFEFGEKRP